MRIRGKGGIALIAGLVVAAVLAASSPGAAASPQSRGKSNHDEVVAYWTHARVAKAVPRDFVYDPASGRFALRKPGGGGGGGSTTVSPTTGASWTQDNLVKRTTGKVLFAFGSSHYVCSASVTQDPAAPGDAARAVVLTAAHCVYDEVADVFASKWLFIPDYDSAPAPISTSNEQFCASTRFGCWSATKLVVHNGYAREEGFTKAALPYDFAFAVVGSGGRGGTVSPDLDTAVGGYQAIDFVARPTTAVALGYPASGRYKGNDLVYCAGAVGDDRANGNDTYSMGCAMTGGSSGGPWLQGLTNGVGTLISVNSYGYSGVTKMFGPKFWTDTTGALHALTAESGGNDVLGDEAAAA